MIVPCPSAPRLPSGLKDPLLLLGEAAPPAALLGVVAPPALLLKDGMPEPVDMVRLGIERGGEATAWDMF